MQSNAMRFGVRVVLVLVGGAALAMGCAKAGSTSPEEESGSKDASSPTHDDDASSPDTSSPQPGDDDSDTGPVGPGNDHDSATPQTPTALPFNVSDQFIPSGYMGMQDGLKMSNVVTDCKTPRQAGAQGDCYTVKWDPSLDGGATSAWCGVYWQSPANNWGGMEGKLIASGATKVTFYAAGAVGGEQVTFTVGGINTKGGDPTLPYRDKFTIASPPITLTTEWQPVEISLAGATYDDVIGGFSWTTTASATGNVTFYIDDVQWQ